MDIQEQENYYIKELATEDKFIENTLNRIHKIFDAVIHHEGDPFKSAPVLAEALRLLKDSLHKYFDLQEKHGILQDMVKEYPRTQHFVKSIYNGDNQIILNAENLYKEASSFTDETGPEEMQTLYENFFTFVSHLKDHRNRINQLVMDTYNLDIGSCD